MKGTEICFFKINASTIKKKGRRKSYKLEFSSDKFRILVLKDLWTVYCDTLLPLQLEKFSLRRFFPQFLIS